MIKKCIVVTVLLFLSYNVFVYVVSLLFFSKKQWQHNVIRAQEYIYSKQEYRIVIVGSSMAVRLDNDLLPNDCYNLSFSGQSVQDGLEIIKRLQVKPLAVFIETNVITRPMNRPFIENLFSPVLYTLRRAFPALLEKHQPFGLAALAIQRTLPWLGSMVRWVGLGGMLPAAYTGKSVEILTEAQRKVRDNVIEQTVRENNIPPEKSVLSEQKEILITYRDYLKKAGITVFLFEMPVAEQLRDSVNFKSIKEVTDEIFNPMQYTYLPRPDCTGFSTTDGVHLDSDSSARFTRWLATEITKRVRAQP
ncbi:MAG: hypothetical protein ACOZF0_09600 [Thermodesulfobacteriota bacterium]